MSEVNQITPALSKDVLFTDKVNSVDEALKTRNQAKKAIKTSWASVVSLILKHGNEAPARRWDEVRAVNEVKGITIYLPQDERLDDKEKVRIATRNSYQIQNFLERRELINYLDKTNHGFAEELDSLLALARLADEDRVVDEEATKVARDEFREAVDKYIEAIEQYNETVEQVADVREYISVVKDVAEISAIAQGAQNNQLKEK